MIKTFTAIDFETAHTKGWSICQVGIVRVVNLEIVEEFECLVQPPDNFYWDFFIGIHGISPEDTADAPTFDKIWHKVEPFIKDQNVVAHNGFGFDFPCLRKTLEYYKLEYPDFTGHCTYQLWGSNLADLCNRYKIPLNHHEALSDARACAKLFLMALENKW